MMEQKQYELAAQVLREVQKVILGKREIVEKVLMAVLAQGHVLLDDVPGVGKTTLAMAFARALGLETRRVQFTPDKMCIRDRCCRSRPSSWTLRRRQSRRSSCGR